MSHVHDPNATAGMGPEPGASPHVWILLDRSGSMRAIASDVIAGFNRVVHEQQALATPTRLTLVQFDSDDPFEVVYAGIPLATVPRLTDDVYHPRGSTPLIDAIGTLVEHIDADVDARRRAGLPPERQLVVVITDGRENASRRHSRAQVFDLIANRRAQGWVFTFLGADPDTFDEATHIGFRAEETTRWDPSPRGTVEMWRSTSAALTASREGGGSAGPTDVPSASSPLSVTVFSAESGNSPPYPRYPKAGIRYQRGYHVHHIQARVAGEDKESWRPARLDRIDEELLHLTRADGEPLVVWSIKAELFEPHVGRRIQLSQPRNLLRVSNRRGGWQYLSVATVEDLPELVYAIEPKWDGGWFYVVSRGVAEHTAAVLEVICNCVTWGEVREAASPELYQEILAHAGYDDFASFVEPLLSGRPIRGLIENAREEFLQRGGEPPADDDPFDPDTIGGFPEFDYPPMFERVQHVELPRHIIEEYGREYETVLNGTFVQFPVETAQEVLAALRRRGYRCTEDYGLIFDGLNRDTRYFAEKKRRT